MVQGPVESNIVTQALKFGGKIPDRILNAPSLQMGLELYYMGFMDLMSSRQTGMGLGPLWWDTIQNYCDKKGLDEEQTEAMHYHLKEMDLVYLKHMDKKSSRGKSGAIQSKHKKAK